MLEGNYPSIKRAPYHEQSTYVPGTSKVQMKGISSRFTYKPRQDHQESSLPSDRFTRHSIHQALDMVETKKTKNREAIEEIRSVNQEIASSLINSIKVSQYQYRSRTPDRCQDSPRDHTVKSQLQWRGNEMNRGGNEAGRRENLQLRSKLNEEMRINNELMQYVKTLEEENSRLRFKKEGRGNMEQLLEENRQLKSRLAVVKNASQSYLHGDIHSQLTRLKTETQALRSDTRTLLHRKPY